MMIGTDLNVILPELVLVAYSIVALMWAVYRGKDAETPMLIWLTALVMAPFVLVHLVLIVVAVQGGLTAGGRPGSRLDEQRSQAVELGG